MTAELDALVNQANQRLAALQTAREGLSQVRGRHTTEDGLITAEVDCNGALISLKVAESITARTPSETAQLILQACRQATVDAGRQRSAVVNRLNVEFTATNAGPVGQRAE